MRLFRQGLINTSLISRLQSLKKYLRVDEHCIFVKSLNG